MKKIAYTLSLFATLALNAGDLPHHTEVAYKRQIQSITFTENKGQVSDQNNNSRPDVLFSGSASGMVYHLLKTGISYQLSRVDSWKKSSVPVGLRENGTSGKEPDKISVYRLDITWLNSNRNVLVETGDALPGYCNYYLEVCPRGVHNVRTFTDITYRNIYENIDLHYYQKNGELKYDYLVAAGANYKQIQLKVKGANSIGLNSKGELIIETPLGKIIERAPLVEQNGRILNSSWVVADDVVCFEISGMDPEEPLIIDPGVRTWGTYYGGSAADYGRSCKADDAGNVYLAGSTASPNGTEIATSGSHQSLYGGGTYNGFLAKFNSAGVRQWATYYGGSLEDYGIACCVDGNNNVYMAGTTFSGSGTVIATPGSHQSTYGGSGLFDAFLVKFNSSGVRLWGTYYGSFNEDIGTACATDSNDNVYLAGNAGSSSGTSIASSGCHQSGYGGGVHDGFIAKFNSSGVRLWGTYYGGSGDESLFSCATDVNGNIIAAGMTESSAGTAIASSGCHQPAFGGDNYDGFLVKFTSGGVRTWGTYYGGSGIDAAYSCAADAAGNVFLSGFTNSGTSTVIATSSAHQPVIGSSVNYDAFLVKFNPGGLRQWGTYYGDAGFEAGRACFVDVNGDIFMAGETDCNSPNIIATSGSHQTSFGGNYDAYLVKMNTSGQRLWGTYYGGAGTDIAPSCSGDAGGNVYIAGQTSSSAGTVIATSGSHQETNAQGFYDAFLVQFSDFCVAPPPPVNATPGTNQNICANKSATLMASSSGTISWYNSATAITALGTGTTFYTPSLSAGTYTFYAEARTCTISAGRTAITVTVSACTSLYADTGADSRFTVFPNPCNDVLSIRAPRNAMTCIRLIDLTGLIIFNETTDEETSNIDLSSLPSGMYLVEISNDQLVSLVKLIKN